MPIALIAEDEPLLARTLRNELASLWPELEIGAMASNGDDAVEALEARTFDIAFLDISMPGRNGLEVARHAMSQDEPPAVVFVTAHDEHALAAFDTAAVDYVLKPVSRDRLARTVQTLKRRLAAPDSAAPAAQALAAVLEQLRSAQPPSNALRMIRAQVGHGDNAAVRLIPIDEVAYFEAADKYVRVVTADGEALIRTPLKELLDQLDPARFWQIHRGTVVNIDQVAAAEPNAFGKLRLRLRRIDDRLDVSRAWAHRFKQM
ncbi:LytTR family DNA-binding domain-containing protein [soil metagenome]